MYSKKYALYFIDDYHEKNYEVLLKKFPQAQTSREYECAIYVVSLPEIFRKIEGHPGQYPISWVKYTLGVSREKKSTIKKA